MPGKRQVIEKGLFFAQRQGDKRRTGRLDPGGRDGDGESLGRLLALVMRTGTKARATLLWMVN
jgi:hypothetical protein